MDNQKAHNAGFYVIQIFVISLHIMRNASVSVSRNAAVAVRLRRLHLMTAAFDFIENYLN